MRYRISLLVSVTTILIFCSFTALSQSCPTKTGDFELQFTRPDTNQFYCRNDVNTSGYIRCTLSCTYKRPVAREINSFSIYFEYIAPNVMTQNFVGSRYMCKPGSTDGRNRQDIQVLAMPEYVNNQLEQSAVDQITNTVFRQLENVAAKCPNAAPQPPPPARPQQALICPERSGSFFRWNPNQIFDMPLPNEPECLVDQAGNTLCKMSCNYRDSNAAGANAFLMRTHWTEKYRGTEVPDRSMCAAPWPSSWQHSGKQLVVHYEGSPDSAVKASAESISREIMKNVDSRAVACPAVPVATLCGASWEKLNNARLRSEVIDDELDGLRNHETNLDYARSELSRWNEVMRGIADPDYNGPQSDLVRSLLSAGPEMRNVFRGLYGLARDADAPTIARTLRDHEAAKVDFYSNAETRIRAFEEEKLDVDRLISSARNELRKNSCGGSLSPTSCELGGDWELFNEMNSMGIWTFTPNDTGNYVAKLTHKDVRARVEIIGRDVLMSFRDPEFKGRFQFKLAPSCRSGTGKFRIAGLRRETNMFAQRTQPAETVLVNGKLYPINFEGRSYHAEFAREMHNGRPADVFHFKILKRDGSQASITDQNGQVVKLEGRFVRSPTFGSADQTDLRWLFVNWTLKNGEWVEEQRRGIPFVVR